MQNEAKVIGAVDSYLKARWMRQKLLDDMDKNEKHLGKTLNELVRVLKCTYPHRGVVVDGMRYRVTGAEGHEMLEESKCDDVVLRANGKK